MILRGYITTCSISPVETFISLAAKQTPSGRRVWYSTALPESVGQSAFPALQNYDRPTVIANSCGYGSLMNNKKIPPNCLPTRNLPLLLEKFFHP